MIIGLTGKNCSGKGEVASFLTQAGYEYFSLSDILREEIEKSGKKVTRDNLIETGNQLRSKLGSGALAEIVLQKLSPEMHAVVDSIRNPFEVEALRRLKNFYLLSIESDPQVRFERMKVRSRESDPKTYDEFLKYEAKEASTDDPSTQQLDRTAKMADAVISNEFTRSDLHDKVREVVLTMALSKKRPGWDDYFMEIARVVSLRSNCIKRKVAALIVKDRRIISTGYNGTPRGIRNCDEGGCPRCNHFGASGKDLGDCLCSHAEENAIVQSAYHGVSIKDTTMYCTFSPCLTCTKMIINSGIKEVVYNQTYIMNDIPKRLFEEAGIEIRQHKLSV
ncbi:MAG: deaminase [Pseudomonadota bacterium]